MDRNIQRLVKQQASAIKPKLTADDLFTSKEYASHIQSLVEIGRASCRERVSASV